MEENSRSSAQNRWSMNIFNQYSSHSTITGIQYLTEPERPLIERIFWICMFLTMTGICLTLTWDSYSKWKDNTIMISQESQFSSISDIPFPAITICPYKKFDMNKKNMTDFILRYKNRSMSKTNDDELVYNVVSNTCPSSSFLGFAEYFLDPNKFISKMLELKPNYTTLFLDYYIWNDYGYVRNLKPILHNKGICYTFNSLDTYKIYRNGSNPHKYLLDNFKYDNNDNNSYIKRIERNIYKGNRPGKKYGFETKLLNRISDNWELCQSNRQGAEIMVHSPYEIPDFENFIFISGKEDVSVSITPRVIKNSDELKSVHIFKRQCYLENERYLQHFQIYTQSNCELECITNITLKKLKCVDFHMPRNKTTKVCGKSKIARNLFNPHVSWPLLGSNACKCFPTCSSISYNIEISETEPFIRHDDSNAKIDNLATLKFYFKESKFVSWKRYESYGTSDFFASIGGIFGLFLGISILSISEIVYFFTIRLYTHYFGRRNRS